jgi:hypothetical protein
MRSPLLVGLGYLLVFVSWPGQSPYDTTSSRDQLSRYRYRAQPRRSSWPLVLRFGISAAARHGENDSPMRTAAGVSLLIWKGKPSKWLDDGGGHDDRSRWLRDHDA